MRPRCSSRARPRFSAPCSPRASIFAESKALRAGEPIPMERWDVSAFILVLAHIYSGWLPRTDLPAQAVPIVTKHNCAPTDLDFTAWLKVYDLAPMLGLDQFAAMTNLVVTEMLTTQYKGITNKIKKSASTKKSGQK